MKDGEAFERLCVCGHVFGYHAWDEDDAYCFKIGCKCKDFKEFEPGSFAGCEGLSYKEE